MSTRGDDWAAEAMISQWRGFVRRRRAIEAMDVDELEDHLRSQMAELRAAGLDAEEAFLIAVKRIGELDALSREFAREHSERLWKQLVVADGPSDGPDALREGLVALAAAFAAALAVKLPALFGMGFDDPGSGEFYPLNLSLFTLPFLAAFLAWKRGMTGAAAWPLVAAFVVAAVAVNLYPYDRTSDTLWLAALHLPIALWFAVGYAYTGGAWRDHERRMDLVRFTGEWFIYLTLIALGGGVFMGMTFFVFGSIGLDAETLVGEWIMPCGVMGAVIVAAWLVENKQAVIENMAPVLTYLFTPLFTLLLVSFLLTMLVTGSGIAVDREVLIGFDLLLVLVVGLLLYAISARAPQAAPGFFDVLLFLLVVAALLVDGLAMLAILARIGEYGLSPNRAAALGENLVLVVNLAGSALLYWRFLRGRCGFAALERWQTAYLPVYALWAAAVVLVFPLIFGFR